MPIIYKTEPGFDRIKARFAKAQKGVLESHRKVLSGEGRQIVNYMAAQLQRKIGPNKIEKGMKFRTTAVGEVVRLTITAPGHAKPHRIEARNASALAFFWPKVGMQVFVPRRGGFRTSVRGGALWIGKGGVDHPGGSLVPLIKPIMEDSANEWLQVRGYEVLRTIASQYVVEVTK